MRGRSRLKPGGQTFLKQFAVHICALQLLHHLFSHQHFSWVIKIQEFTFPMVCSFDSSVQQNIFRNGMCFSPYVKGKLVFYLLGPNLFWAQIFFPQTAENAFTLEE